MWIVLLDCSGSMNDPFENEKEFAGRKKEAQAAKKLEAAKIALIEHMLGLGSPSPVRIFAFRDRAEKIFDGSTGAIAAIRAQLATITASGGTNIAAALDEAAASLQTNPPESFARVLVISDGLSNFEAAETSARRLERFAPFINVVLIDPSEEGERVARAIARNGQVEAVNARSDLTSRVDQTSAAAAELARAAEAHFRSILAETKIVHERVPAEQRLSFTSAHPSAVHEETWFAIRVLTYLAGLEAIARERAQKWAADQEISAPRIKGEGATRVIPRGTKLMFTPNIPGLELNPPRQEISWYEDLHELDFRARSKPGCIWPLHGLIEVTAGEVPIVHLPIVVQRAGDGENAEQFTIAGAKMFRWVFASYSHQDAAIVEAMRASYLALGIAMHVDKHSILAGEAWWVVLKRLIVESDLFQLYWSEAAAASENVAKEWKHALSIENLKNSHFIRPFYWSRPLPKPPIELEHQHFEFLDLTKLDRVSATALKPRATKTRVTLPVAAVPLIPNISEDVITGVREDVSAAVHFLEETLGLHYQAVPTLIVDQHVVRRVRAVETIDNSGDRGALAKLRAAWALISAVAMEIHSHSHWRTGFERTGLSPEQLEEIRRACEVVGPWLEQRWYRGLHQLGKIADDVLFSAIAPSVIKDELDAVPGGPQQISFNVTSWRKDTSAFSKRLAARRMTSRDDGFSLKISTTRDEARAFAYQLLEALQQILPRYDNPLAAEFSAPSDEETLAAATLDSILNELRPQTNGRRTEPDWTGYVEHQLGEPYWIPKREELARAGISGMISGQPFAEFLPAFLRVLSALQHAHLAAGDQMFEMSCDARVEMFLAGVSSALQIVHEPAERYEQREPRVRLSGRRSELLRCFDLATAEVLAALPKISGAADTTVRTMIDAVSTYGIFAPIACATADDELRTLAATWSYDPKLTLPKTPRVLVCLETLEALREELENKEPGLARHFQRSILIHEHFHAFLETAATATGDAPAGPQHTEAWRDALALNEALAAWMQLHHARNDALLSEETRAYISRGEFPAWPYRAAETIEAIHREQGIDAVRRLVEKLRNDPTAAALELAAAHRAT